MPVAPQDSVETIFRILWYCPISEFRVSETARSWARIRDKNNFIPYGDTSEKAVPVEFVPIFFV